MGTTVSIHVNQIAHLDIVLEKVKELTTKYPDITVCVRVDA